MRIAVVSVFLTAFTLSSADAGLITAQFQTAEGGNWLPISNGTISFGETDRYVWQTVPSFLADNHFSFFQIDPGTGWPDVSYGMITFTVAESGPAYIAVTTRFGAGGNSSGDWMPQLTTEAQLEAQGWAQVAAASGLGVQDLKESSGDLTMLVFERDSLAGDSFSYRTEKYIPPILLQAVPEPSGAALAALGVSVLLILRWRQMRSRRTALAVE